MGAAWRAAEEADVCLVVGTSGVVQPAASLAGVLVAEPGHALAGRAVLVVDDVMTTGATLNAAREALLGAGASEVRAAFVARTAPAHEASSELRRALALLEPAQGVRVER